jgi:hypothetical protein
VAVGSALLVAAAPALGRTVEARLVSALTQGLSGSVTYGEIDHGKTSGQVTTGIVGKGKISGKLSFDAKVAATVLGAVKGVPLTRLAGGGSYVVRFDIDAKGNHKGFVVIRFASPGVGSLCLSFVATYGRFVPGTSYVPSTETFATAGGTGAIAKVRAAGKVTQGNVTGTAIEQILAHGTFGSLQSGAPVPMSAGCAAVAKL